MVEPTRDTAKHYAEGDVARLKQIEAQTRRMNKVFMDGADPIVIRDLEGNVLDLNLETERVFGWNRDELLGRRTRHLLAPEYRGKADQLLKQIQQGETVRNAEAAVTTKQGVVVPVLVTAFLLTDENQQPVGYAEIIKDITGLKEATAKLEQRNRELQQFGSVLAHDLGAPLRSIRGFIDLLQTDCGDELNEDCRSHLHYILESALRMEQLIGDLLGYTRIENQQTPTVSVDCDRAFQQAVANLHAAIATTGAEITSDPLPTIEANPTQIVQLFQNLIDNAIKYCRSEPPRIHISATQGETGWEFTVRDNGIGIESKYLEKVFDVFRRLHTDDVIPGTGIGLATCKAIVERHGGRIWVESRPGTGSTFHFAIPQQPHT